MFPRDFQGSQFLVCLFTHAARAITILIKLIERRRDRFRFRCNYQTVAFVLTVAPSVEIENGADVGA